MSVIQNIIMPVVASTYVVGALPPDAQKFFERRSVEMAIKICTDKSIGSIEKLDDGSYQVRTEDGETFSIESQSCAWEDGRCGPPSGFKVTIFNEDGELVKTIEFNLDELRSPQILAAIDG